MKILKESNSDWLYMQLHMFKKGVVDERGIKDELIYNVRPNGIITLKFDTDEEYFKLFDLPDDDIWALNNIFSMYGNLELMDRYTAEEDWNMGYVLSHFNEENSEKMEEIKRLLAPNLNLQDDTQAGQFCKLLENLFTKKIDYIIGNYESKMDNAYRESIKVKVKEELCDILMSDGIYNNQSCFYKYMTTVDNLIKLYDKYGSKSSDLYTLLKSVGHDKSVSGSYLEDMYSYYNSNEFDHDSFNNSVSNQLDNIMSDMEDNNMFINLDEYSKIVSYLTKKFKYNTWYGRPKDEDKTYIKIIGVDPKNNKIEFQFRKKGTDTISNRSYDLEQFNNFLYHPELFD